MSLHSLVLAALLAGGTGPSEPFRDESSRAIRQVTNWLRAVTAGEPDVVTVQKAAEALAAPSREEAESWRRRARVAGLLPRLHAEYRHDERSQSASGISSGAEIDYIRLMPGDTVVVRLTWDLDELILGRSELPAGAAAQTAQTRRHEAAERVTKLYFERMRLRLLLVRSPPGTPEGRAEAELELAAVTAQLHALTGLYREELQ
jgi:hypothetical protein